MFSGLLESVKKPEARKYLNKEENSSSAATLTAIHVGEYNEEFRSAIACLRAPQIALRCSMDNGREATIMRHVAGSRLEGTSYASAKSGLD